MLERAKARFRFSVWAVYFCFTVCTCITK